MNGRSHMLCGDVDCLSTSCQQHSPQDLKAAHTVCDFSGRATFRHRHFKRLDIYLLGLHAWGGPCLEKEAMTIVLLSVARLLKWRM